MDAQEIITLVNTLGFPIFVCIVMMFLVWKIVITHKDEMKMMSDTIDNNTLAMSQIKTQLETVIKYMMGNRNNE